MNITSRFRETIQLTLLHHKNIFDSKEATFLKRKKEKNSIYANLGVLKNQIYDLKNILQEGRKAYFNSTYFYTNKCHITSEYREEIEFLIQNITNKCLQSIKQLKQQEMYGDTSQQNREHNIIMISIIEEYLQHIHMVHSEEKALKTKKTNRMRQVYKLRFWKKHNDKLDSQNSKPDIHGIEKNVKTMKTDPFRIQEMNDDWHQVTNAEYQEWNPKDIQLFEAENQQLYNELNTLIEEMNDIENKVVCISELQNIFSEKVLYQDKSLEHVLSTVVGSTENVKEANEQIRNAIQRNAGFRVWILFFLLVLSFSLMFLDWYKP